MTTRRIEKNKRNLQEIKKIETISFLRMLGRAHADDGHLRLSKPDKISYSRREKKKLTKLKNRL